ncbi:MAG TPA: hypothetical protein VHE35_30135 [Kofleriaceae bacterium]|nr:hypothetical protein [Kofleriaceae bacterium]
MTHETTFEGVHCTLKLRRPAPGLVVLILAGTDIGELGRAPFEALDHDLQAGPIEVFIDARHARTASVAVSSDWAMFFRANRQRITRVHMLASTRFLQVSAGMVRDYALLEERMTVLTDPAAFERLLGARLLSD